ncbi:permease-like cell division protein FtsX [Deferribacterales bacterium Es71-Z0220]|uniref:cell division protein FtsX n=1 Tax=Deferrivibrio essentukiensis TaxID=2880922 RepID=UPI001F620AE3|nr:permease-like cell division protein FtsX [Deferrivibrio essentukiensis]MBZ4672067.1 hypothetical protein [Deferribacteraceae bacterium]MCB4205066.1 permease-like cell division protein FtsX [Deferrivibrio essentukiensis]
MKKFLYLINKGFVFYKSNFKTSLISLLTLTTIFFIYQFLFTIGYSTNMFFNNLSSVQNVRVYLKTDDNESINEFIKNIKILNSVESVTYYSKDDSYNYLKNNTYDLKYIENISKDYFPSFIEIQLKDKFKDIIFINQIKNEIGKFDIVDVASFGEQWVLKFASLKYSLQIFILFVTILLSISVAFISMNVISLNLYKFREEIKIYSLVGATKAFIIIPFIFATVVEFFVSFIVSLGLNTAVFYSLNTTIMPAVSLNFIRIPNIYIYSLMAIYFFSISIFSSYFTSVKFLRKASKIDE